MAVLGSHLLEDQKKVGETAEAIQLRQSGENSVLSAIATSQDLQAIVAAWQAGTLSKDTMFELFRRGEILPDGRTNQDEAALINSTRPQSTEPRP